MTSKHSEPCKATWEEKNTMLVNAFRKLPIKRFGSTGIPYDFLLPDMGQELLRMTPVPRPKTMPAKKARHNLVQSTNRIVKALDCLPQPVLDALHFEPAALRKLKAQLRILLVLAKQAKINAHRGAPHKIQPEKIALVVARHYHGLTGKKPTVPKDDGTAYGPFLSLLKTVFGILGVKASAESQANKIAKNWNSIVAKF